MLRIVLLISLLATLIIMISRFSRPPLPEPQAAPGPAKTRPLPPIAGAEFLRKQPVRPPPDVYNGYLFNEDRKLEDADFGQFGHGSQDTAEAGGGGGLEQVYYAGSLIVGKLRQGMITYREAGPAPAMVRRRPGARGVATEEQTKVLVVGDRFRGYEVTKIEPDKIVFEKGGEKVEKFLFDQNKQRSVPTAASPRSAPVPAPGGGGVERVTPPAGSAPNVRPVPPGAGGQTSTSTARTTRARRFQRRRLPTARLPRPVSPTPPDSPNIQPETER